MQFRFSPLFLSHFNLTPSSHLVESLSFSSLGPPTKSPAVSRYRPIPPMPLDTHWLQLLQGMQLQPNEARRQTMRPHSSRREEDKSLIFEAVILHLSYLLCFLYHVTNYYLTLIKSRISRFPLLKLLLNRVTLLIPSLLSLSLLTSLNRFTCNHFLLVHSCFVSFSSESLVICSNVAILSLCSFRIFFLLFLLLFMY